MKNYLLEKFRQGTPVIGTISHLKSTTAIEAIGAVGLDYVMLDTEHCPMDISEVHSCIVAADAAGMSSLVRVNEISRSSVLQVLDIGAAGVIVPGIESVEQVLDLIQYAKFRPLGNRGYCMTRDGKWGLSDTYCDGLPGYMSRSNTDTLLIPQCETLGCLHEIEAIAALPGVDGILIGPYDLSIAMGIDGQFQHPDFLAAVTRIREACRANGKMCIIFVGGEAEIKQRLSEGFDSILVGLDVLALIGYYSQIKKTFLE